MASAFARIQPSQLDREIEMWLRRVALAFQFDRASLAQVDAVKGLSVTHQWAREGIAKIPIGLNVKLALPWLADRLLAGQEVMISHEGELPFDAAVDRAWARAIGFKSNLSLPLKVGGVVVGGMALGSVVEHRIWSQRILKRARMVADLFGNALERQREALELRQLAEEIQKISRVAMMGELTAALAHELNQPLGAIVNNAHAALRLLAAGLPDRGEIRAALEDIVSDNARAVEIVRSVRGAFKLERGKSSRVDVMQVLRDVDRIVRGDASIRGVSLSLDLSDRPVFVIGDRAQLIQALLNLVLNAFDAVCESQGPREVTVRTFDGEPGQVHVAVADSGKGIAPDVAPQMFNSFFTTKSNGMGMGLAIARSIVENHRGRLLAFQNRDRGATLEVMLPLDAKIRTRGNRV
ncbi:MAG TPA: ATP-binding protein [Candidatus Binataceae bacterium]|nr:ATP-binding protein [Candidatus Binataceae bacterium]